MARRAARGTLAALAELESLRHAFGADAAPRRRALLAALGSARLPSPRAVERFHELLCWSRAYPDDAATLALVERLLAGFPRRADLRAAAARLVDSGLAGTEIEYPFFTAMSEWLAARWPERLSIDWDALAPSMEEDERLDRLLQPVSHYAETMGLDEVGLTARQWLDRLRGRGTDATYLARGLRATGAMGPASPSVMSSAGAPSKQV